MNLTGAKLTVNQFVLAWQLSVRGQLIRVLLFTSGKSADKTRRFPGDGVRSSDPNNGDRTGLEADARRLLFSFSILKSAPQLTQANCQKPARAMTAGHKSTQQPHPFFYRRQPKRGRLLHAAASRGLRAGNAAPESAVTLILALADKLSVTKTWNLCLPAHDPPFFSISCTSHSPAYGYGKRQQRPCWQPLAAAQLIHFSLPTNSTRLQALNFTKHQLQCLKLTKMHWKQWNTID